MKNDISKRQFKLNQIALAAALLGSAMAFSTQVLAQTVVSTDDTYTWPNDASPNANQTADWGQNASANVNGVGTTVLYEGTPVDPQDATVQLNEGASLTGGVSSTATNTTTNLTMVGGNTVGGSIEGVDNLTIEGQTSQPTVLDGAVGNSVDPTSVLQFTGTGLVTANGLVSATSVIFTAPTPVQLNAGMAAQSIDFNDQAAELTLANNQSLSGDVSSTGGVNGTINFAQNGTATGDLGIPTSAISLVEVGTAGTGTVGVTGGINATNIEIDNGSTLNVTGNVTGPTSMSGSGATFSVTDGNVDGAVTTSAAGTGTFTLGGGTQTVTGNVGSSSTQLSTVNAGNTASDSSTFNGAVYANTTNVGAGSATFNGTTQTDLDFTGSGTANLNQGITGNVDFENQAGTVNVANNQTIDGSVGSTGGTNGTLSFAQNGTVTGTVSGINTLNVGSAAQGTVTADGNVNVGTVSLQNSSTLAMASGTNLTGNVTTAANGTGTLTLAGGTQAVDGNIGAAGAALQQINAGNGTSLFNGTVNADNTTVGSGAAVFSQAATTDVTYTGTGTVVDRAGLTGNVDFANNAGTLVVAADSSITGDVSSTGGVNGTVEFTHGGSVTGDLGTAGSAIAAVDINQSAAPVSVDGDINATTVNVVGNSLYVTGNVTAATTLADNSNLSVTTGNVTGNVSTTSDDSGTFTLAGGTQTVNGDVGANGTALNTVNAGNTASDSSTFNGAVYAYNTNVGAGTATFNGTTQTVLGFTGSGTANLNAGLTGYIDFEGQAATVNVGAGQTLNGAVENSGATSGTLNFEGSGTATSDIGDINSIDTLNVGTAAQGTVTVDGNIFANTVDLQNNSTLTLAANNAVYGNVTTSANDTGTLTFAGGSQGVYGTVGASGAALQTINAGSSASDQDYFSGVVYAQNTQVAGNTQFAQDVNSNVNFVDNGAEVEAAGNVNGNVDFQDNNALLELYPGDTVNGSIASTGGTNGTVWFIGDGEVTGSVGTAAASIGDIEAGIFTQGTVVFDGNVYANTVKLDNDSTVVLAAGQNLTGNVTTASDDTGTFTLAGGTQTVTGNVGVVGKALQTVNAGTNAGDVSTFDGAVNAYTTNVGAGTATFNGATATDVVFGGNGTANLNQGLTGNIDFVDQAATVNVANNQVINGSVASTGGTNGTLSFAQSGEVTGDVGSSISGINTLNVGTAASGTVLADGNVFANTVALQNSSDLTLASGENLTGNVTTSANNTGALTLAGGTQTVTGTVGAKGAALALVDASAANAATTFTGPVTAQTIAAGGNASTTVFDGATTATQLDFAGNGTVVLNGVNGLTGNANFGTGGTGTLQIGDGVNVAFNAANLTLSNAGDATLTFAGSSAVTGVIGATAGTAPAVVAAGANGSTVSFANNVNAALLSVSGTGTVDLNGNLNGALTYAADGTVNVANSQAISGLVTTANGGTGTLNFLGSATPQADIGSTTASLNAITFNEAGTTPADVTLAHNLYANTIELGANTAATVTSNLAFGGTFGLAASTTSLNLNTNTVTGEPGNSSFALGSGTLKTTINGNAMGTLSADTFSNSASAKIDVTLLGSNVALANGQALRVFSAPTGNTGATTLTAGNVTTNSAAVSFTAVQGGASAPVTNGNALVDTPAPAGGQDLYLVASVNNNYANAAGLSASSWANPAGQMLGSLAMTGGAGLSAGMQTVLSGLDAENAAQLQSDIMHAAPLANGAVMQSAFSSSDAALANVGDRLQVLREEDALGDPDGGRLYNSNGDESRYSVWAKGYGQVDNQSSTDGYGGYTTDTAGSAVGIDTTWQHGGGGVAFTQGNSSITADGNNNGDSAQIKTYQLAAYATQGFGPAYIEGLLSYGMDQFDTTRLSALNSYASGNYDGSQFNAKLSGGYQLPLSQTVVFTPIVSLQASTLHQDNYTESGAGALDLAVDSKNNTLLRESIGARLSGEIQANGMAVRPEMHAFVNHDDGDLNTDVTAEFTGGGTQFITPGLQIPRTSFDFGAGLTLAFSKRFALQFQGDVEARSELTSYGGSIIARGQF